MEIKSLSCLYVHEYIYRVIDGNFCIMRGNMLDMTMGVV